MVLVSRFEAWKLAFQTSKLAMTHERVNEKSRPCTSVWKGVRPRTKVISPKKYRSAEVEADCGADVSIWSLEARVSKVEGYDYAWWRMGSKAKNSNSM